MRNYHIVGSIVGIGIIVLIVLFLTNYTFAHPNPDCMKEQAENYCGLQNSTLYRYENTYMIGVGGGLWFQCENNDNDPWRSRSNTVSTYYFPEEVSNSCKEMIKKS